MKKILLIALVTLFLSSCGVGSYSITTGLADEASISFVANEKQEIQVVVDDKHYDVETVKLKDYRKDRNIKRTVENTIILTPGTHNVKVLLEGNEIFTQKIYVSAQESKVIEL